MFDHKCGCSASTRSSLVPQTPIREEKGSGNIAYSELCQWNSIIITYVTGTMKICTVNYVREIV